MINNILQYLLILAVFLILDFVWLSLIAKKLYKKHLSFIIRDKPNFIAAFIFYAIFTLGLMVFVINPAIEKSSLCFAIGLGALFGLISYSTYDLTNLAMLENWPIKITIIDMIWGSVVTSLTAFISYLLINTIW